MSFMHGVVLLAAVLAKEWEGISDKILADIGSSTLFVCIYALLILTT